MKPYRVIVLLVGFVILGAGSPDERWLAYVYLEDGFLFNTRLILEGYARAYTKYPFFRMDEFRDIERNAKR